jgi:uncharacterized protein (DUF1810 family)
MKYDLNRFKIAKGSCYLQVFSEIKNDKKTSHWMWFIFPQIAGLGKSGTVKKHEIENIKEAELYLMDALLSKRLIEITGFLTYEIEGKTAEEIFGFPDYLKFHSSMTLFYSVAITNKHLENNSDYSCFEDVIRKYYNGTLDKLALDILKKTTLFTSETPYQFKNTSTDQNDFNFKLEFIDIQPADKRKPPVGTLNIKNKEEKLIAKIENAMRPICWSLNKNITVTPMCKMHWLNGFHQKFAVINFEKRSISFLKEMHKVKPRIINKVEDDKFLFINFNKDKNVVEGCVSSDANKIEKTTKFL